MRGASKPTLSGIEKRSPDSGVKGSNNERIVMDFLADHVPAQFYATHAQILDASDALSDEVDVVACNQYQPLRDDDGGLFIAEGVDFVVQVKAIASTKELDRLFANCRTVKELKRVWPGDQVYVAAARSISLSVTRFHTSASRSRPS